MDSKSGNNNEELACMKQGESGDEFLG